MSYKCYDPLAMEQAVSAVRRKKMSQSKAAKEFGVPKSTLQDQISGKAKHSRHVPGCHLSSEDEDALVNLMVYMSNQGLQVSRQMIRCFIQEIVRKSGCYTSAKI